MKTHIVILGFFLLYTASIYAQKHESLPADSLFWSVPAYKTEGEYNEAHRQHIEHLLAHMTPEQRVAQTLLVSWHGHKPSSEIMRWIQNRNIGGIKVFGWNGKDLPALVNAIATMQHASIHTENGIPLFTATDQEGGWVRHVKGDTSQTSGNMAIGASQLPYDAMMSALYIGMELRQLGINMNFAPTVDVYQNPNAHVIGPRAFSSNPALSGLLGTAYYQGLQQAGIIATAKHFPGHGSADGDSHGMLPQVFTDYESLWQQDMLPFRMLVREGIPAMLSAHIAFPNITDTAVPASLSTFFAQTILRDRLQYQGILITDDLYMGGAQEYGQKQNWSMPEISKAAIAAGSNIIMLSRTPEYNGEIWKSLITAYTIDNDFRTKVDDSVRKILRVKLQYLRPTWRVPLLPKADNIQEFLRTPESQTFFFDQAGRSVTIIKDSRIPYRPNHAERILLAGNTSAFFQQGQKYYPQAETFRFRTPTFFAAGKAPEQFAAQTHNYDSIIFSLSDPASLDILQAAKHSPAEIIVCSSLTPIYLAQVPWIQTAVAVYGSTAENFELCFAALSGDFQAGGILPIQLE